MKLKARKAAVYLLATIASLVSLGLVVSAYAESAVPVDSARPVGPYVAKVAGFYTLGAFDGRPLAKYAWCHEIGVWEASISKPDTFTINNIAVVTGNFAGVDYGLTQAQMAYVLRNYEEVETDSSRAAIAFLVHANFERQVTNIAGSPQQRVNKVLNWLKANRPDVLAKAREYVLAAKKSGWHSYASVGVDGEGKRIGNIHGLGMKNQAGEWIAGVPMRIVLDGPAKFVETGTNTWAGSTKAEPISLKWEATGNGVVTSKQYFPQTTIRDLMAKNHRQHMLLSPGADPAEEVPGPSFKVIYDFQPVGVSQVETVSLPKGAGDLVDTITVSAAPYYVNPQWIEGVPVKYEAEVYYIGQTLPVKPESIPAGVKPIAATSIIAKAPGKHTATVKTDRPGFYTWVWKVVKTHQGEYTDRVHGDWSDKYLTETETQVQRYEGKIRSSNNLVSVHGGSDAKSFINDWITISDFPTNHGDFKGYGGITADIDEVKHELYCVKGKVTEGITRKLKPLWAGITPARNGNYRIADMFPAEPGLHVQDIDCRGSLIWVSSFVGDDRVEPIRTSDLDSRESYNPTPPTIKTTATDKADGDKYLAPTGIVTITDTVTYTELAAGKEYTLTATLIDKTTGKPFMDNDNPVIASLKFTPAHRNGTVKIDIPVRAELLVGKATVVFEDVTRSGKEPILHTDINDEGQTIYSPHLHTTATTPDGGKLVDLSKQSVTITDKVEYSGLQPGQTYTLVGSLMNKQDCTLVTTAKPIVFKASKTGSGEINVPITVPTTKLKGHNAWVVFEDLHLGSTPNGKNLAQHHDLAATEQTVTYQPLPQTGAMVWVSLLGVAATAMGMVIRRDYNPPLPKHRRI